MEIIKKILVLMVSCVCVLNCNQVFAFDQGTEIFDYSFVNDDNWKNLPREERLNSCQIPEEILKEMDTNTLFKIVLECPFTVDVYAFNTFDEGLERLCEEYNGMKELLNRNDFDQALLDTILTTKSDSNPDNVFKNNFISTIFSTNKVLKTINMSNIDLFKETIDTKKQELDKNEKIYSNTTSQMNLIEDKISSDLIKISVYATSTVKTPKGTSVSVINNSGISDFSSAEKTSINNQTKKAYPSAILVSGASKKYNCHSYSWYSQSTSNSYWMNDPSAYMTDGSYKKTGLVKGNKVYSKTDNHTAIVDSISNSYTIYISKWGTAGVYRYYPQESPYTKGMATFWGR